MTDVGLLAGGVLILGCLGLAAFVAGLSWLGHRLEDWASKRGAR